MLKRIDRWIDRKYEDQTIRLRAYHVGFLFPGIVGGVGVITASTVLHAPLLVWVIGILAGLVGALNYRITMRRFHKVLPVKTIPDAPVVPTPSFNDSDDRAKREAVGNLRTRYEARRSLIRSN